MKFILQVFLFLFATSVSATPAWQADFEKYLDDVVSTYNLPGIAVEVVGPNGMVIQFTRGFRDVTQKKPVTPETLYAIGSTSKAFTGVLLAQLRDQGRVNFDEKMQTYWPEFHIKDANASALLTIHDLGSHWTGLGRHDFAWYHRSLTRAEMVNLIPLLEPTVAPRKQFLYNNFMWVALGQLAEKLTGRSWEQQIQSQIFDPLGMSQSLMSTDAVVLTADHAEPYGVELDGTVNLLPFLDIGYANPAGGIYSNLNDMAKWVQMQLNDGEANGRRIVSKESLLETHKGYSDLGGGAKYGMGWASIDLNGHPVLTHDGGIDGFLSNVSLLPNDGYGVVVLMNTAPFSGQAIAARLWAHILNQPVEDLVAKSVAKQRTLDEEAKKTFADPAVIKPAADLKDFAGKFCNEAYGQLIVTNPAPDRLHANFNSFDKDLLPNAEGEFFIPGIYEVIKYLKFNAAKDVLQWQLEDTLPAPIDFKRCG